ncbi:MAG: DUF4160 domain-containing protein [Isosphaeraceae bacterium]
MPCVQSGCILAAWRQCSARWPYRSFFDSGDRDEPPHFHVGRDDGEADFWVDPVPGAFSGRAVFACARPR